MGWSELTELVANQQTNALKIGLEVYSVFNNANHGLAFCFISDLKGKRVTVVQSIYV